MGLPLALIGDFFSRTATTTVENRRTINNHKEYKNELKTNYDEYDHMS